VGGRGVPFFLAGGVGSNMGLRGKGYPQAKLSPMAIFCCGVILGKIGWM